MSSHTLQQGITLIQQGQHEQGARMIRYALHDEQIQGAMRSTGYLWLAETATDPQEKLNYYQLALAADPGNNDTRQRIALIMQSGLPPAQNTPSQGMPPVDTGPVPTAPTGPAQPFNYGNTPSQGRPPVNLPQQTPPQGMPPVNLPQQTPPQAMPPVNLPQQTPPQAMPPVNFPQQAPPQGMPTNTAYNYSAQQQPSNYRTVGILNGPNGRGTGFFVTQNGLLVTTRFVVGGLETVQIELEPGRILNGQVVRSFPSLDLTVVHTGLTVNPPPTVQTAALVDNTLLAITPHNAPPRNGAQRPTRSFVRQGWFTTTFEDAGDAGGSPIFNRENLVVGMLTRNTNRTSSYLYGLHISTIHQCVELYWQAVTSGQSVVYCAACGNLSLAGGAGAFYCEHCGYVLPRAQQTRRYPLPQFAAYYGENNHPPCPNCSARVGYYDNHCLRCGYDIARRR